MLVCALVLVKFTLGSAFGKNEQSIKSESGQF